jgi:GT2 family glycosyltransferase
MDRPQCELSIVVVSYNTVDMTLACLESIRKQTTRVSYEVIVVDNLSPDGSADLIEQEHPWVQLVRSEENLGFACGNNAGVKESSGKYVLLLNPDTVVLDHAIDVLVEYAQQNPSAGIWGGRTMFGDRSLNPASCWRKQTLWNLFCRASGLTALFRGSGIFNAEAYGSWNRNTEQRVDIVSGCFFLTTRSLWDELDGFDSAFFMYGEEADLCLRAKRRGAHPRITPHATIIHYGGASEQIRGEKLIRLFTARVALLRRHWHPRLVWFGVLMHVIWALTRKIAFWVMARVQPARWRDSSIAWSTVWRRRKEWLRGTEISAPDLPAQDCAAQEDHAA